MSEPSSSDQTKLVPEVDWAGLKIAIDDVNAALALVRGPIITIYAGSISLMLPSLMQFTGNFDSLNGDDTALLSDINSRARGLRQAVSKDEKHTLSPEAIVRYVNMESRARTTHVSHS